MSLAKREWVSDDEIVQLAPRARSWAELASILRVPRKSLTEHALRQGTRAAIEAAFKSEVIEPRALPEEGHVEIPVIVRDYSHLEKLSVYPLGDVHKGSPSHRKTRWREWLDYIRTTPTASLLGTGDFLNSALANSKSDVYEEMLTVGRAKRELRDELMPLAMEGRLDLLMPGNHEYRIIRAIGDCPIEDLTDSLGVPYARAAAMIVYLVGDQEYEVYLRHGTGNGQSLVALQKGANTCLADVYVTGHTHRQSVLTEDVFAREGDRVCRKRRFYVSSGSFLGYEDYAAERGYAPSRVGAPRVNLDGRSRDIKVSV